MRQHNMDSTVICTGGGPGVPFDQDFCLRRPTLSTCHVRSRSGPGYEVGTSTGHGSDLEFCPSADVDRVNDKATLNP